MGCLGGVDDCPALLLSAGIVMLAADRLEEALDEAMDAAAAPVLPGEDNVCDEFADLGDREAIGGVRFGLLPGDRSSPNRRVDNPGDDGGVSPNLLLFFLENRPRLDLESLFFDTDVSVTSNPS